MGQIRPEFYLSKRAEKDAKVLLRELEEMYTQLAQAINKKPDIVISKDQDPSVNDTSRVNGTLYLRQDTQQVWILDSRDTSVDPPTVSWTLLN